MSKIACCGLRAHGAPRLFALLTSLATGAAGGCDRSTGVAPPPPPPLSTSAARDETASFLRVVEVPIGRSTFRLEVADTPQSRELGLMYRDALPENTGMLFVFPVADYRAFWMKNTRIPLDILYLNADRVVVSLQTMRPFDLTPVPSGAKAKYAIELNAGAAAAAGVRVGDRIDLPPDARHADR